MLTSPTPTLGPIASYQATLAQLPTAKGARFYKSFESADRYILAGIHEGAKLVHKTTGIRPATLGKLVNVVGNSALATAVIVGSGGSHPLLAAVGAGMLFGITGYQLGVGGFTDQTRSDNRIEVDGFRSGMSALWSAFAAYELGNGNFSTFGLPLTAGLGSSYLGSYFFESQRLMDAEAKKAEEAANANKAE